MTQPYNWFATPPSGAALSDEPEQPPPNASIPADTLSEALASEDDCLAIIGAVFPSCSSHVPFGRGDDCAELAVHGPLALSTDFFWQDAHFRTTYFTPEEAGAKALAVAVSDLAGAGAEPLGFSLSLMLPSGISRQSVLEMMQGMRRIADAHDMTLAGGDISRGDKLGFSITVWGKSIAPDQGFFLRRAGAEPGDVLFIVGQTGLARAGLLLLERKGREVCDLHPVPCAAHLRPQPHVEQGIDLARLAYAAQNTKAGAGKGKRAAEGATPPNSTRISLMDMSDGLARDLPRLLGIHAQKENAPVLGAELVIPPSLISPDLRAAAQELEIDPLELILIGGEDYALLGSCAPDAWPLVQQNVPEVRRLGLVTQNTGIRCNGAPFALKGFDHFAVDETHAHDKVTSCAQSIPAAHTPVAVRIMDVCSRAWQSGLLAGFNGNVSRRVDLSPREPGDASSGCIITRSGAAKNMLTLDDFALLALPNGTHLAGANPSTEAAMHLAVYRKCPDARAILHCHPPHLLALSLRLPQEDRLNIPLFEAKDYRAKLGFAPELPPGSSALADAVALVAKQFPAVWMERHGLMVHGITLRHALALAEELEQLARIHLASLG